MGGGGRVGGVGGCGDAPGGQYILGEKEGKKGENRDNKSKISCLRKGKYVDRNIKHI